MSHAEVGANPASFPFVRSVPLILPFVLGGRCFPPLGGARDVRAQPSAGRGSQHTAEKRYRRPFPHGPQAPPKRDASPSFNPRKLLSGFIRLKYRNAIRVQITFCSTCLALFPGLLLQCVPSDKHMQGQKSPDFSVSSPMSQCMLTLSGRCNCASECCKCAC
ncbi:hypothetical protein NDU88_003505 [Pleurodeles waltl]|uniref:Uncharacterized protein n=1 Tax=Pleurodeles waltl TaxID=8319 RepID=A0AAV7LFJ2_PLEWA|nr:hypothetical protein NDU88_003505 [Pleurodeles waltl]